MSSLDSLRMNTVPRSAGVLVVGGGLAGLVAANRCRQLGYSVVVAEKGEGADYRCNSRFATGVFHISYQDVMDPDGALERVIEAATSGTADRNQMSAIARNGRRVVRWLQNEGGQFIVVGPARWQSWVLAPPTPRQAGLNWPGRAGDVLLRRLRANLTRRGGTFSERTRVTGLKPGSSPWRWSAELELEGGSVSLGARHVVFADGGFQGDAALVKEHIGAAPDEYVQRGAGTGGGDCLRMAMGLNASLSNLSRFYGHVLSVDAFTNNRLWPLPWIDELAASGLVVDRHGTRFLDEGLGGVYIANELVRSGNALGAFTLFDSRVWQGPGRETVIPSNPLLKHHGATMFIASDIAGLATLMSVPADRLLETVNAYNDAVRTRRTETLAPKRSVQHYEPYAMLEPPFYAMPICAGITYTMGGIRIDGGARVLDNDRQPIAGLYAAGACTGGLEGGGDVGYVGGLIKASVFGLLSAESIAASS